MATDGTERTGGSDLPADVVDDILASRRRRRMLAYLAEQGGAVCVDDVVGALSPADDPGVRSATREEVFERDLPKLTATGIVEYDSMRDAVRLADRSILAALPSDSEPSS